LGKGEADGFQVVNMFTVVLGILCNSNFRSTWGPPGAPRGALALYLLLYS